MKKLSLLAPMGAMFAAPPGEAGWEGLFPEKDRRGKSDRTPDGEGG